LDNMPLQTQHTCCSSSASFTSCCPAATAAG
jgi:hypothetical protein